MSGVFDLVTGQAWKLATIGAGILAVILTAALVMSYVDNKRLDVDKAALTQLINDPETGYVVQLAQARTNEKTLRVLVEKQNKAYSDLSASSKAQLAASERKLVLAQAETKRMEKRLADFLATKPQGSTLEARVRDIDQRALEDLLK